MVWSRRWLPLCLSLLLPWTLPAANPSARQLARRARQAEHKQDFVGAYLLYAQAAAADSRNPAYWARSQALRTRATLAAGLLPQDAAAAAAEPESEQDRITEDELAEVRRPQPPVELAAGASRQSFDLTGDSRALWEKVSRGFGLEVIFDSDYQTLTGLKFGLQEADYREAIRALEAATGSFLVPISPKRALVVRDNTQKRQELEPTMTVSIPIPHPVTVQEAQELARTVQQTLEMQRLQVDSVRRIVVVRDRVSKVKPALELFRLLARHKPEVAIQLELLELSESASTSYGLNLPTRSPLVWLSSIWNSAPDFPSAIRNYLVFGAGRSFFGLGITNAEMFATMARAEARSLMVAEVRSLDGQPATFHLGDKYPILSVGYFGAPAGTPDQPVFTPPPSFNFEDLGLVLKATPKVHDSEEVSLELEAEFKVLTGQTLNGIPVIANRKFISKARLRFGDWAVLAGLLRVSEARTLGGLAGLGRLPVLGGLVRSNDRSRESGETLLLLKPVLLSLPVSAEDSTTIWLGSEGRLRLPI